MTDAGWLLTDDEFAYLTDEERAEYLALIDQSLRAGKRWSLDETPRGKMLHLLAGKIDWLLGGGSAGGGKRLDVMTPILTPDGFLPMGDIHPGMYVYGRDGRPTMVTAESPVVKAPALRVTFDDGSVIVADPEHRWLTFNASELARMTRQDPEWQAARRRKRGKTPAPHLVGLNTKPPVTGTVRTTAELAATLTLPTGRRNHAIPVAQPLEFPTRTDLPIDPYVLGVWLGDGSSASGQITTIDPEIVEAVGAHYRLAGVTSNGSAAFTYRYEGLFRALRLAGFINNKHVPWAYLSAAEDQRLALLQGLMDTDGTVAKGSGSAEFTNTNRALIDAVAHLFRSLGMKATIRYGTARLDGRVIGPCWTVKVVANRIVFRLPRKASLQRVATRRTTRFRYITSIEPHGDRPMKCIAVDADDHLYLAGLNLVPTHNSESMAYHALHVAKTIPGSHSLILRTSLPELRRSFILRTIVRFAQTGDNKHAKLSQRDNVRAWWFDNGSVIEFGFLAREEHVGQYLSAEYDFVGIDESTQLSSKAITMITGRLRTTAEKAALGSRPHALFCTNPGDQSHEWHKELFVDLTDYGRLVAVIDISRGFIDNDGEIDWDKAEVVELHPMPQTVAEAEAFQLETDPERHLSIGFVPFGVRDNPFVDASVLRGLNALPEMERRQKRDGDWDAFTGRYFTEFNPSVHVRDFHEVPASWDHGIGLDHGFAAPYAAIFGAWDPSGNCWVYDECYERRMTPPQQAAQVLGKLQRIDDDGKTVKQRVRQVVADPAVFSEKGEGDAVGAQWARAGLHAVPANRDRIAGWMNVREYLRVPLEEDGTMGEPKLFISSSCGELIREMKSARQDPKRPDDVDTTGSDHACVVGSTKVTTQRGHVPIRRVRPGDYVDTPIGWRRVVAAGRTGRRRVGVLRVGPFKVKITPDHPVATVDRGWVKVGDLTESDTIALWPRRDAPPSRPDLPDSKQATPPSPPNSVGPHQGRRGLPWLRRRSFAWCAAASSNLGFRVEAPSSAISTARWRRTGSVAGTGFRWTPPARIGPGARTRRVYNLTVDEFPEFFANGILVHNCDALRYLLATRPRRWKRNRGGVDWSKSDLERANEKSLERLRKVYRHGRRPTR